ncbi:CBO0543 family protein [Gorillibacterium sp. sgz5001074]|uniref:CBO0543 family protein n=1 Tax=Gorillibacterium sp. sgz5001074 TaxID=3446695 RepID=UPI003F6655EC
MDPNQWFDELSRKQTELGADRWGYWREHVLFTFDWWLLLLYFVVGWFVWWRLADKRKLTELLPLGLYVLLISLSLDMVGAELGLWDYPKMILPWGARLAVVDAVLPLFYMLVYQYTRSLRGYTAGLVGLSLLFSFVLEPFMVKVGVYRPLQWKHLFSVPGYLFVGLVSLWLSTMTVRLMKRRRPGGEWSPAE